jgi:uncharacterized membrane protein
MATGQHVGDSTNHDGTQQVLSWIVSVLVVSALSYVLSGQVITHGAAGAHESLSEALQRLRNPASISVGIATLILLVGKSEGRRWGRSPPYVLCWMSVFGLLAVALSTLPPPAHHPAIVWLAVLGAVLLGFWLPLGRIRVHGSSGKIGLALWGLGFIVYAIFSMHRHASFGSGSWDLGCMVHNLYRASRGLDSVSTVLDDVSFLGDHFMPGLYLFVPFAWVNDSAYMVLLLQSASLAVVGPVVFSIASRAGASRFGSVVLGLVTLFSFGLQSAAYFDAHEITMGFGFLAGAIWAVEKAWLRTASLLLVLFALFKESSGPYVVGIGLLALYRARRTGDRCLARYGASWVLGGALWLVLVIRVFMPWFIASGNSPEPHETFQDFGPTVFEAAMNAALNPDKAFLAMFLPKIKLESLFVTLGGVGWMALCAPEILLAALPLLGERFLSSKATMWEMGYHYAAPLCFYAAWATACRLGGIERWFERARSQIFGACSPHVVALYLGLAALLVSGFGYRHSANFWTWNQPYFSRAAIKQGHQQAIAWLKAQDDGARIAAQNRLLPHLANRPFIYRLQNWQRTDFVVLAPGESAWPMDDGYPARLARELQRSPHWQQVFAEGSTQIFARVPRSATARHEVTTMSQTSRGDPASESSRRRYAPLAASMRMRSP